MSNHYTLWVSGYLCTGMEGIPAPASLLGVYEADTFDEAMEKCVAATPEDQRHFFKRHDTGRWTQWGCWIYDNEAEARKGQP